MGIQIALNSFRHEGPCLALPFDDQRCAKSMPMLCGMCDHETQFVPPMRQFNHMGICANTKIHQRKEIKANCEGAGVICRGSSMCAAAIQRLLHS
jgi:hypothetical protein